MRILIIDADSLMRDGLSALLALRDDIEMIGAIDGIAAMVRIPHARAPEVVILDIAIADYEGPRTITAIHERWPMARVLVLTLRKDEQSLKSALRAGVDGYLLKSDTRLELLKALRAVSEGRPYVSPTISQHKPTAARQLSPDGLSERERHVMMRIAQGLRTREIALELSLSHKTIEKYRSNLMRKLGLKTAGAVAAYAIANGYLEV
jgi:DNA-binding NarL/FixJ family response regulator